MSTMSMSSTDARQIRKAKRINSRLQRRHERTLSRSIRCTDDAYGIECSKSVLPARADVYNLVRKKSRRDERGESAAQHAGSIQQAKQARQFAAFARSKRTGYRPSAGDDEPTSAVEEATPAEAATPKKKRQRKPSVWFYDRKTGDPDERRKPLTATVVDYVLFGVGL